MITQCSDYLIKDDYAAEISIDLQTCCAQLIKTWITQLIMSAITREMTPVTQSREATEVKTQSHIKEPERRRVRAEMTLEKESRADRGVWGKKG